MLKLNGVVKYFNRGKKNQVTAINHLTLEFPKTGLIALLGPSGCGKTTLLNAIGGCDSINEGSIYIDDLKINKRRMGKRDWIRNLKIGYIFQDYKLVDDLSVYDNVALSLKMLGLPKEEIKKRVEYVLSKLDMLRFKKRPCNMLSGGERQRIGIARALVKNPEIILADEPTGNLDSKNSLNIMNIIKEISKNCLVILVTHEVELAKFYADRILEIQDGSVVRDYINEHDAALNYEISNRFYLKDFKTHEVFQKENTDISLYTDTNEKIKLEIVVTSTNIYIKNLDKKIEVVDENSNIEFIDSHKKEIKIEDTKNNDFHFENWNDFDKKYTSIYHFFTIIKNGFQKVFAFPILKKILLVGFFIAALFTTYSFCSIRATLTIKDADFVTINPNYLMVSSTHFKVSDYLKYEAMEGVNYLIPGNSVTFQITYDDFYQTSTIKDDLTGSLSSLEFLEESDLIYGHMPTTDYEIVVSKMSIMNMFQSNQAKMAGITKIEDLLEREVVIPNMPRFKIVGITDLESPSIYVKKDLFMNILANNIVMNDYGNFTNSSDSNNSKVMLDYNLYKDKITLKEGRYPVQDYEVILPILEKENVKLNKEIDTTINGKKLKVVGFYESRDNYEYQFVNLNTIKYSLIEASSVLSIYASDKDKVLDSFQALKLNIKDSYLYSKEKYIESQKNGIISEVIVSLLMLGISLIEIFLMTRSSLLSRVREIGILRAIGVKRLDIYKMFTGEIIAITTLTSLPGILFMTYCLKSMTSLSYFSKLYYVGFDLILFVIIFVYLFNLLVGLIPVFNIVRKSPASIMSRNDLN